MRAANRHLLAAGLAIAASLVPALARAQTPLAPEALFEQVAPSVWVVRSFDANQRPLRQGSAVVIAPGRLITNCHVLRQARSLSVGRENVSYGATLEHPDTERDLCQLKVANFHAPAVSITTADTLRVGARVYAIGAPRGLETTLSDGLLSGLRRNGQGQLDAIQITVPLSGGSSGGGLFDAQGRLIGITTYGLRDSQNLNFALPGDWIAEVPARAQAAIAARQAPTESGGPAAPRGDRVFEYRLVDRMTGNAQNVVYRLDRSDGDKRVFNQGSRIERADGHVLENKQALGGEFDLAMPPGGWVSGTPEQGNSWRLNYERSLSFGVARMELRAVVGERSSMRVGSREIETVQVRFDGFTQRPTSNPAHYSMPSSTVYAASAWYAPSLGRVVRFEAQARGTLIRIDEVLELVDIRSE